MMTMKQKAKAVSRLLDRFMGDYTANTRHKPWRVLCWVGFPAPDEAAQNKKRRVLR